MKLVYVNKIRCIFWIFVFLLMTEGIFRRWLLPQFNNIFLVVRDPFVIYAVYLGIKCRYIRSLIPVLFMLLSLISFVLTLMFGHGNLLVALYGVRINLLYIPFIYICAKALSRDDIIKLGAVMTYIILPMVALTIMQFFSPQSSLVNIGVGGDEEGAGFGGAEGFYRPPGIFTFISGLTDYYAFAFPFILYFLFNSIDAPKYKLYKPYMLLTLIAYIISLFVSISRTHMMTSLGVLLVSSFILFRGKKAMGKVVILGIIGIIIYNLLLLDENFELFVKVFFSRFDSANDIEGSFLQSLYTRTFGWLGRALDKVGIIGYGEGHFSNVGMKILYGGELNYTGALKNVENATEMEWGRLICEDGLILGLLFVFLRFCMAIRVFKGALKGFAHNNYILWFLMPMACVSIVNYQLKTAYNLGFMVLEATSCFVLIKYNNRNEKNISI